MNTIESILNFIIEIEKLKNIYRKTKPVGLDRFENSAEHSWHVCLTALIFKDYANEPVDIAHVIKMLLIHDLGEIDAGGHYYLFWRDRACESKRARRNKTGFCFIAC